MTARTLRGDSAQNYLEASMLLDTLGPDPDAARHWDELGRAIGRTCRIPHCGDPARAGGMCDMHYRRHRRASHDQQAHIVNRGHAVTQRRTEDIIEDVEWMLDTGEAPERIPQRLGTTPAALTKRMRRAGRPDLAAPFQTVRHTHRQEAS